MVRGWINQIMQLNVVLDPLRLGHTRLVLLVQRDAHQRKDCQAHDDG